MKINGTELTASGVSDAVISQLHTLKTRLETTGCVSRQDVLSIEEFAGMTIITKEMPINGFTKEASAIGCDEVIDIVTKEISNARSIEKDVTYAELTQMLYRARNNTEYILRRLKEIKNISGDVMDRFINEKYIFSYIDENRVEQTDITDISARYHIFSILSWNTDYINSVLDTTEINTERKINITNKVVDFISKEYGDSNPDDLTILPLITALTTNTIGSLIYDHSLMLNIITVRDIYKMYKDIDKLISETESLLSSITYDLTSQLDTNYSPAGDSNRSLMMMYKRYQKYNDVAEHAPSKIVLDFFAALGKQD